MRAETSQVEAIDEAGLANVGDLVRYAEGGAGADDNGGASDDVVDDADVLALSLETGGEVSRDALRRLVGEARALLRATAALRGNGQSGFGSVEPLAADSSALPQTGGDSAGPQTRSVGC